MGERKQKNPLKEKTLKEKTLKLLTKIESKRGKNGRAPPKTFKNKLENQSRSN